VEINVGKIKYLGKIMDFIKDEWFSIYNKISKEPVHDTIYYINFQKINLVIILQGRTFEMMILFLDNGVYHSPEISSRMILFILIVEK